MKNSAKSHIGILSITSSLPKKIISASDVSHFSDFTEEELINKLGFKQKKIASSDEHPSKFALNAAKKALYDSGISSKELDFIIYCSNGIYDYQFWSPSAYLQSKIKADNAIAFEINNGCNAATAGMFLANNLLDKKSYKFGLVVVSDTLSKLVDYKDKASFPLFSFADGAAAVLLGKDYTSNVILGQALFTVAAFQNVINFI